MTSHVKRLPCAAHLVGGLWVYQDAALGALQRLLHLLQFDGEVRLEVAAQGHAGVLPRLPAGKDLIIAQQGSLVLQV